MSKEKKDFDSIKCPSDKKAKELISYLHKYNDLNERIVFGIGVYFRFDSIKYCRDNGITYNL